jgi:hypothetical protein
MFLNGDFQLWRGDAMVLSGNGLASEYAKKGISRIPIEGGADLILKYPPGHEVRYMVQGYFAAANSPYRFSNGTVATEEPQVIFVNDSDKDFLVRTMVTTMHACFVHLDGTEVLRAEHIADSNPNPAFVNRRGALTVPPASQLTLSSAHSTISCAYIMEGEYLQS